MKKYLVWLCIASLSVVLAGCDWSAGGSSDGFNTSKGAGVNINVSGVYSGAINGRAVERTSGAGQILSLVVSQSGNTVEVTDNQGSRYQGTIGAPGAVATATGGIYPAGAELVQYQINFSGKDNVAAQDVEFVGTIHAVSVTDIRGTSSTSGSSTTDQNTRTTTETVVDVVKDTTTDTITTTIGAPGDPFYRVTTQVIVTDNSTGDVISNTTTTTGTSSTTTTRTYSITEANTQMRLEGTWIEAGGLSARVDAISRGVGGTITETSTETVEAEPAEVE
ncbi:MAG TPA: hypothetical protein PKM67_10310 [Kiritimatiellia bacterium]|nr:hypothetical protein [Kiritimatiellia bacterium]